VGVGLNLSTYNHGDDNENGNLMITKVDLLFAGDVANGDA
jgi:hypothetical protein